MASNYEEFDPQQRPIKSSSENLNLYPDASRPLDQPHPQYQPQPGFVAGNQYQYPPPSNPNFQEPMNPIVQQQMPVPLSYGIPIEIRSEVRTVPTSRYTENLFCFNCQRVVPTQIVLQAGAGTWTSALLVAMVGCFLGCCLIPFCIEDCQDAKHVCSSCGCELGKKRFLFS